MHTSRKKVLGLVVAVCGAVSSFGTESEKPVYSLSGPDTGSDSAFVGSGTVGWNNDKTHVPSEGNDYRVVGTSTSKMSIRTPVSGDVDFKGDSLTLGAYSEIQNKYNPAGTLNIPRLIVDGGVATLLQGQASSTATIGGACEIRDGATLNVSVALSSSATGERNWTIDSEISGSGTLGLVGNANSAYNSTITLGNITNFVGQITVTGNQNPALMFNSYPADPPVFSPAAFLCTGGRVRFMENGAFGANRGFTFAQYEGTAPAIYVESGKAVRLDGALSGVTFNKGGEGTLILTAASSDLEGITVKAGTVRLVGAAISLYPKCRIDGGNVALDWQKKIAYVDPSQSGNLPPYESPTNAASTIDEGVSTLADGGRIVLAPGDYDLTQESVATTNCGIGFTLTGPDDRSANLTGDLKVWEGQVWASVTYNAESELSILPNGVVSNMTICGGDKPVQFQGKMVGCLLKEMTGPAAILAVYQKGGQYELRDTVIANCRFSAEGIMPAGYGSDMKAPILLADYDKYAASDIGKKKVALSLVDCSVIDNDTETPVSGAHVMGGVFTSATTYEGSVVVANRCRFVNNVGRSGVARLGGEKMGTALYATNCLFVANRSSTDGQPLIWGWANLVNCTFSSNEVNGTGIVLAKGALMGEDKTCRIKNCVFSGNVADATFKKADDAVVFAVDHTVFPEATATDGNLVGPATFLGNGDEPYRLTSRSVGRKAGDPTIFGARDRDLTGHRRTSNGQVDCGCYQTLMGLLLSVY